MISGKHRGTEICKWSPYPFGHW